MDMARFERFRANRTPARVKKTRSNKEFPAAIRRGGKNAPQRAPSKDCQRIAMALREYGVWTEKPAYA
jgi:hypothetical protein